MEILPRQHLFRKRVRNFHRRQRRYALPVGLPRWKDGIHLRLPQIPKQATLALELLYQVEEDDWVTGPVEWTLAHAGHLLRRTGTVPSSLSNMKDSSQKQREK